MATSNNEDDDEDRAAVDPLADLMFGLVAIVIPTFALMLPMVRMSVDAEPAAYESTVAAIATGDIKVNGETAEVFLAAAKGLHVAVDTNRVIEVDRIADDVALAQALERLRERGQPVLLMIEPDGQESAFLFEGVVARHGPARISQVRLDRGCAFARDLAIAAQCAGQGGR